MEVQNEKRTKRILTKKRKLKLKIALIVAEVVIVAVLVVALFFVTKLQLIERDDDFVAEPPKVNELEEEVEETLKGYTTIALMGLDNRTVGNYAYGNTDCIILVSINNETKEIRMVSVYRDTYLQVTEEGKFSKINSAYNRGGGAKGLVEALNRNLDLAIEDYVAVDWYSVAKTVNLLGGVEIELTAGEAKIVNELVAENIESTGIQSDRVAKEGLNELDGIQALAYARIRKIGNDYARTERQRLVISKMLEKAKDSSVGTLLKIVDEVFPDISTSLTNAEIIELASGVFSYSLTETQGFPEDRGSANVDGVTSYIIPVSLMTNVEDLHLFLYGNEDYVPSVQVQEISNHIIYKSGLVPDFEEDEE